MFRFFKIKKKEIDDSRFFNGKIDPIQLEKFSAYARNKDAIPRDYFTYEEFVNLFNLSNGYPFVFIFDDISFAISNGQDMGCLVNIELERFSEKKIADTELDFINPKDLLENLKIDGHTIKEIWNELQKG